MNKTLVTIAVPVYNTEKYLNRCIASLAEQTHVNLEIILVDDCSTDTSSRICDEWASKDSRIQVIHKKKNEGQGIARNDALDIAQGKYICFIDSDDFILNHTIETTLAAIESENAELAVFGLRDVTSDGKEGSIFAPLVGKKTYRGIEVQNSFLPDFIAADPTRNAPHLFYTSACLMLYSVEKLHKLNWHFVSERIVISEDLYSLLDLMDQITSVTIVPEALYCYCYNTSSFSRKYTADRYNKIKSFYIDTIALCSNKKYSKDVLHRIAEPFLSYTLATLKQEARHKLSIKNRLSIISSIINDKTLQDVLYQKRNDFVNLQRKIIFSFMRRKWTLLCFFLFFIKH